MKRIKEILKITIFLITVTVLIFLAVVFTRQSNNQANKQESNSVTVQPQRNQGASFSIGWNEDEHSNLLDTTRSCS